ncbi:ABC transporter substrate-binding protein [Roseimaritima ulvae]|uniref:Uncharacterized protein n=1 Tax=Roseimaritima ulvae TaxID=980254 RepID=A0A5B9QVK4_9BACT|nr:ABC transporter substrate-binding protein [Roseimaritima ulvae]QEG41126.1 hypothetical protein UC8_31450 [Roseimaritima ulvae]
MRVVKVLIVLVVVMMVAVPVGVVGLLTVVAAIGQSASSEFDELQDVQTVAHEAAEVHVDADTSDTVNTDAADAPETNMDGQIKRQAGNVTLYCEPQVVAGQAEAVLLVLNSKCLLGASDFDYAFEMSQSSAGIQLKLLDEPEREFCRQMQPVYSSMATILSHICCSGQPLQIQMFPNDASEAVVAASRDDVAGCWFDNSQSVFFDQVYPAADRLDIIAGLRNLGLLGSPSDLVHFFYRRASDLGEVDVIGNRKRLADIPPTALLATLRHRALHCSLELFDGQATKFAITDTKFQAISSFEHVPPFTPTRRAQNGCMLFLGDDSISQETLDAIAARTTNVPGREITVDFWLRNTEDGYAVLVPSTDELLASEEEFENAMYSVGRCINSELPQDASLVMIGCDFDFHAKQTVPVSDRAAAYLARNNNRLDYWHPFDQAFADRVADYFEAQGLFAENGAAHVEIFQTAQPQAYPCVQLYVNPENFSADMAGQVEAFSRQMAAELFPDQVSVFQLCDARGRPLPDFVWYHPFNRPR